MKRLAYQEYVDLSLSKSRSPLTAAEYLDLDDDEYRLEKADMEGGKDAEGGGDDGDGDEGGGEGLDDGDGDEMSKDDDEGAEDESEGAPANKSLRFLPTEEELLKSVELLVAQTIPPAATPTERRLADLSKAAGDGTLSPDGRLELADLLTKSIGDGAGTAPHTEQLQKSLADDPIVDAATDASEFLAVFADSLVKALGDVEATIRAGRRTDQQFQRTLAIGLDGLAKAMVARGQDQDNLLKSMSRRIEQLEKSPLPYRGFAQAPQISPEQARGPRDAAPIGSVQAAAGLSKSQVAYGLQRLFDKAIETGDAINKSRYANLIPQVETAGDWRMVRGLADPILLGEIVHAARQ